MIEVLNNFRIRPAMQYRCFVRSPDILYVHLLDVFVTESGFAPPHNGVANGCLTPTYVPYPTRGYSETYLIASPLCGAAQRRSGSISRLPSGRRNNLATMCCSTYKKSFHPDSLLRKPTTLYLPQEPLDRQAPTPISCSKLASHPQVQATLYCNYTLQKCSSLWSQSSLLPP